jgi:hypothetical protein
MFVDNNHGQYEQYKWAIIQPQMLPAGDKGHMGKIHVRCAVWLGDEL